jgi:hypothetical protein
MRRKIILIRDKLWPILILVTVLLLFTYQEAWSVSFSLQGFSADEGQLLSADVVAEVTNPPSGGLSAGTAVLVVQITNTTPASSLADPVIAGFGFNLVGAWDDDGNPPDSTTSLDEVGTGIDTGVSPVDAIGTALTNLGNTVKATDFQIDLNKHFPASGGLTVDVQITDQGGNDRGIVRSGASSVDPAEYIEGPVSFEFSFLNLTASLSPANFIARFQSAGALTAEGAQDSGVATSSPEPATLLLFGSGLAGLGFVRRRRRT